MNPAGSARSHPDADAQDDAIGDGRISFFLEIILQAKDFHLDGRDQIEDPLDDALRTAHLGEITGGGTGIGSSNIDVEVTDLEQGLALVRKTLQSLGVARSTVINQYDPVKMVHRVYDGSD